MKDIRFKSVKLTGFRGQTREIDFNNDVTRIVGANGTGKTTVYVAVKWCLTGVDEHNRTNYNLFDDTLEFSPENSTPVSVELKVDVSGVDYTFRRQATQKWVRKRGSAEYTKAPSDDYKFYIDGLEVSATSYKDNICELFNMDIEKLKLCVDIVYYQRLDWKELRKHFADIVGKITDSDMEGDYSEIMPYLEKYKTGEKAKEFLRQQINPLAKQIDDIHAVIKAQKQLLPDLSAVEDAEKSIAEQEKRLAEINKEILGLEEANKPYIEKRKQEMDEIRTLKEQYSELEIEYDAEQKRQLRVLIGELDRAKNHNANIEAQKKRNIQALSQQNALITLCKEDIEELTNEYNLLKKQNAEIKAREFTEQVCPNCGQPLPAEKIAELRKKFYEDKDIQRAPIVERGKLVAARLETQRERLSKLENTDVAVEELAEPVDIASLEDKIAKYKANIVLFADTDKAKELNQKIADKEAMLTVIPEIDSAELQEESARIVSEIKDLSKITARRDVYSKALSDIEKYKEDEKAANVLRVMWQGRLDKIMSREREWANIVSERANKYLEYSHVEMIDINKSGELIDTCTLSINGVDRSVTNHANKTIIGIDISNAICKRYDISLPVFVDDFEHFTSEFKIASNRQVIMLSANADYPNLSVI